MVIPKGKYVNLEDFTSKASSDEIVGLMKGISTVAKKIGISSIDNGGFRTLSNVGERWRPRGASFTLSFIWWRKSRENGPMIISVKRNFLELKNINELVKKDKPEDNYSVKKTKPDFQLNKFFYKQIGKKYRWTDRLIWSDLQWSNYVSNKNLETYVIKNIDDLVGFLS